ncbi:MAG: DinB family protein [Chloroflexota bacterium]|nr:DinB family protein [Chloroflexota bacterium]
MSDILQWVKAVLSTTAPRWLSLTESLPADLLTRKPAPNEWSAVDCLQHLLDTEQRVFPVRMRALLAGEKDIPAFDPDTQGTHDTARTPAQLAAEFARYREANLANLEHVTESDLTHTARHSELGAVTLGELLHEWAAHDLMHTVQAERALMQPFILACGPWQSYFSDHDARNR